MTRERLLRKGRRALRNARAWTATLLGLGVAGGVLALVLLQMAVAEIDDEVRHDE